jgi:class 3 adenylate cyclase
MAELPTGTVTLLLADVQGSTRLWETQPEAMKAAVAQLDHTLAKATAAHNGVRPVEQGEGDSFVIAFARAADAVACALDLQRAPLAPIRLRIGLHTGDVQLRHEGNYIGPTINRTARLRDLAGLPGPHEASVAALREALGDKDFDAAWAALSEQFAEDLSRFLVFDRRRGLDLHELRPLSDELQYLLGVRRLDYNTALAVRAEPTTD